MSEKWYWMDKGHKAHLFVDQPHLAACGRGPAYTEAEPEAPRCAICLRYVGASLHDVTHSGGIQTSATEKEAEK